MFVLPQCNMFSNVFFYVFSTPYKIYLMLCKAVKRKSKNLFVKLVALQIDGEYDLQNIQV